MTVAEIMNRIREIKKTSEYLLKIKESHSLNPGEVMTIEETIDIIDDYIDELGNKKVQ